MRIEAANAIPWTDVEHALTGGGDGGSCWCQWYLASNAEFRDTPLEKKRESLHDELAAAAVPPGFVAYVEDVAAGWCRVSPRPYQSRLAHTNIVTRGTDEPMDAPDVWAITCFVVRREYRRQGVAKALLASAIELATQQGARVIEAYPVDLAAGPRSSVNGMYTGTVEMYLAEGFVVTSHPKPGRAVMALRPNL